MTMRNLLTCVVLAGAVVAGGFGLRTMWRDSAVPGQPGDAPPSWPAGSAIARTPALPTLVMFAHPRCPCTRASLDELRAVITPLRGRLDVQLWIAVPPGAPASWSERDALWRAADIPGVTIHFDHAGVEAARFGAHVSGQVVLYDAAGRLRYQGGVTGARGHEGANAGADRLAGQLQVTLPIAVTAPVFGCPLFSGASS